MGAAQGLGTDIERPTLSSTFTDWNGALDQVVSILSWRELGGRGLDGDDDASAIGGRPGERRLNRHMSAVQCSCPGGLPAQPRTACSPRDILIDRVPAGAEVT
jgi:hypothetical protein